MPAPVSVCFYRRDSYGLFDTGSKKLFGGAEVRSKLFAEELARRAGFRVTYLVAYDGQPRRQQFGAISVVTEPRTLRMLTESFFRAAYEGYRQCGEPSATFPWFRLQRWRPGLLWQIPALVLHRLILQRRWSRRQFSPRRFHRKLGCQVFCCFGANDFTAEVIASCRRWGMRSLVFVVSDLELSDRVRCGGGAELALGTSTHAAWYSLTYADEVVVQTVRQQEQLGRIIGREGTLIRSPVDLPPAENGSPGRRQHALWIGRAERTALAEKRPELCLELARRCPEIPVLAVMNPVDPGRYAELRACKPANLTMLEHVPFEEIDDYFRRAFVLLNTSSYEGFPNTFLQAGKHALPILSMKVDPDGILNRHGCGVVCGDDLDRMAAELRRFWRDPQYATSLGRNARRYVEAEHDLRVRVDELVGVLNRLMRVE
ncbi:MAG TPA: glycosyltransferase family 4 protein [Gemmataceae bacterium]|nr:glycosyltransferase family 4 protein [Gemmataceae bacterium]